MPIGHRHRLPGGDLCGDHLLEGTLRAAVRV